MSSFREKSSAVHCNNCHCTGAIAGFIVKRYLSVPVPITFADRLFTMEVAYQPLSSSSYIEPVPASASQPTAVFPMNQQHQPNQQTPSSPRPLNSQSNERPSTICGFTWTELASVTIQVAGIIIAAVFGAWAVKSYESANIANQLSEESLSQSNAANRLAQDALQQSLYANRLAKDALQQSSNANILAIINLCLSEPVSLFPWSLTSVVCLLAGTDVRNLQQFRDSVVECSAMIQAAPFASVINSIMPSLPTLSPSLTMSLPPPTLSGKPMSSPAIPDAGVGSKSAQISFGAIVGIIIAVVVGVAIFCLLLVRFRRAKRSRF